MRYQNITLSFLLVFLLGACASHSLSSVQKNTSMQSFTIFGIESVWRATVNDKQIFLEGDEVREAELPVERMVYAKGVEFNGQDGTTTFTLNIRTGQCIDQNGRKNPFSATLFYGEKILKGCAVDALHGYAPT